MEIQAIHVLPCSAERFWQLYFDDACTRALQDALDLARCDVLEQERRGDLVVMRVHIAPRREVPAAVRRVLRDATLAYDEIREIDVGRGLLRWRAEHPMLGRRFACSGTVGVHPEGDARCRRVLDGRIRVHVPGVGRLIERSVAADVGRSYDTSARFIARWIEEERHG